MTNDDTDITSTHKAGSIDISLADASLAGALLEDSPVDEIMPAYLTIKDAAQTMGVSSRSVYGYIEEGKLPGEKVEGLLMVREQDVRGFKRRAPGRQRTVAPRWRIPPQTNPQYMTTIRAAVRPGQSEALENRLTEMRMERRHLLPGTAARYVLHDPDTPDRVVIVLIWYSAAMPPAEERAASLAAFYTELADVLDWQTAICEEGQVLIHA